MRPWHVALLVLGAGLAGVLALELSEPQSAPVTDWRASPSPPPAAEPPPETLTPPPANQPAARPAPILQAGGSSTTHNARPKTDDAPAPVFMPPPQSAPEPKLIRKNKPNPFEEPVARSSPVKPFPGAVYAPEIPSPKPLPPVHAAAPTPKTPVATAPVSNSPAPERRHVTLEPGITLAVRVNGPLPGCSVPNETFTGALTEPLIVNDLVIAERGARVSGRCGGAGPSNQPQLVLSRVMTADGQWVPLQTAPWRPGGGGVTPTTFRITYPVTITERALP